MKASRCFSPEGSDTRSPYWPLALCSTIFISLPSGANSTSFVKICDCNPSKGLKVLHVRRFDV